MSDVVILSAKRTPIGSFLGELASESAPQLGAIAISAALSEQRIPVDTVEQVILGNVLQAGQGQAPARQAALYAELPPSAGAITLHKVCGSGLRAVMDATNGIRAGEWDLVVAGGMENMSQAPHILPKSRSGYRMGHVEAIDTMVHDGLWDPYGNKHMGNCAEMCAQKYQFSREEQDQFALTSYQKARACVEAGSFGNEIAPVSIAQRKGEPISISADEEPFKAPLDKMARLRPAFEKSGTITAANASKINDGAAALVVSSMSKAQELGVSPMVRVVAHASYAQEPDWFTTAPVQAAQKALAKAGLNTSDIDLWEINEAFSVVTMAAIKELGLDANTVNTRGGAVALGHPIGASGARILVTLIHTLIDTNKRYGCASICIGGGEAAAVIVENIAYQS